jgi:hypothetical protein
MRIRHVAVTLLAALTLAGLAPLPGWAHTPQPAGWSAACFVPITTKTCI